MFNFKSLVTAILIIVPITLFVPAQAQEKFTISGGGGAKNKSVYSDMLGTIAQYCNTDELTIEEVQSSGGPDNLVALKGNKVKAAIIPTDVLLDAKLQNASSVAGIQTLFALHPEDEHLIARGDAKVEGGVNIGKFNIGGKDVVINNAEDLKGRPLGAVGGSAVTARILSELLKMGWIVTPYPNTQAMLDALTAHQVDAVLISAGSPSPAVASIKGNFKLLPIRGNADTANVYQASKVQYPNLNGNRAVDTLSARALLVSRTFRSQEMLSALGKLRACLRDKLDSIKDADGSHAAWQSVSAEEHGNWTWYTLPDPKVVIAPSSATKVKAK